jgi:O-glycosyl hydrolase
MKPADRFAPSALSPAGIRHRILLVTLCALSLGARAGEPPTVHLSPPDGPKFDGWGTSLCWFANAVGRWPEPQRSEIADALFSVSGLGLTVVRYNIGGGEKPGHHHMPWFRQMEGFEPAAGTWNWEADPGQRWMLDAAVRRGANRLEAFSNAPPYWMTLSKCVAGAADPNTDNLDPKQETAFAEYLTEVVKHFRDTWGIRFDTLEPMNEPFTDYWRANHNQEGCHFERGSQARLIQLLRTVLDQHGLDAIKISAADETNYDKAIETWKSYDVKTRACVAQINAHAYATDRRLELRALARESGKPLVMSEVDGGGGKPHDHAGIGPALTLAGQIIDDLRDLQPLRWVFWQAVEDEEGQVGSDNNWGLIHADLQGESHTWALTKKYHAMAHFSKFIRPGAVLVSCDAPDTVAAYDRDGKMLVVVTRNAQLADETIAYDLAPFGQRPMRVEAYRTSATEDMAKIPAEPATKALFSAVARAQSVTTYVMKFEATPKTDGL